MVALISVATLILKLLLISSLSLPMSIIVIKELLNLNWEVNLSHTLIEGSTCADFLAKFSSKNDSKMKIWNHLPNSMKTLLNLMPQG